MTPDIARWLTSPGAAPALALAQSLDPALAKFPANADRLGRILPPSAPAGAAKAALELAFLRRKAARKFDQADKLFFTAAGYEMASGTATARHRAHRLAKFGPVADLTAGIGGDAIELARLTTVTAFERDEPSAIFAAANLAALGLAGEVRDADGFAADWAGFGAVFLDPTRRTDAGRSLSLGDGDPALSAIFGKRPAGLPLCVKAAPGVPPEEIDALIASHGAEAEFVSHSGELKECVLWLTPDALPGTRATAIGHGGEVASLAGMPGEIAPAGELGRFLLDPDPAVVRARLVGLLGETLDAWAFEPGVAFLTSREVPAPSPLFAAYEVEAELPPKSGAVRDYLTTRGVRRVTPLKRASSVDAEAFVNSLKLPQAGHPHRVLAFTRLRGSAAVLVLSPAPEPTTP